jgi:hypothetical protein
MTLRLQLVSIILSGLAAIGLGALLAANAFAAPDSEMKTITGCLDKSGGQYVLTQEATGQKFVVRGSADLEKHSANHKVTLKGNTVTAGGESVFEVSAIEHVSNSCDSTAKPPRNK